MHYGNQWESFGIWPRTSGIRLSSHGGSATNRIGSGEDVPVFMATSGSLLA